MREYEFNGIDVTTEMLKFRKCCENKQKNLNEDTENDKEFIQNYVNAANSLGLIEQDLVVGEYYCPMAMQAEYLTNEVNVILVIKLAQYLGSTGSRLHFKYDACDKPIYFLSDDGLILTTYRFVFSSKTDLDTMVTHLVLQLGGSEKWTITARGFTETGELHVISNIQ